MTGPASLTLTQSATTTPTNSCAFATGPSTTEYYECLPVEFPVATQSTTVTVRASYDGIAVALTSSNPAVAPVPSFITVPEGASTTHFTMTVVVPASEPDIATGSIVTATLGTTSKTHRVVAAR